MSVIKVRMLEDFYREGGKHEVWWAGDIREIDEVRDQIDVDYLEDTGVLERVVD